MVIVNGVKVPTCTELADVLRTFGDQPLVSGNGWWTVYGFGHTGEGIQIAAKNCPPEDREEK